MLPTMPGSPTPAPAPAAPSSPQALPYSAYPAPQFSMATATQPSTLLPPIQQTQSQIGDALAAARGPQPQPQLAVQPPGPQRPNVGALGQAMMNGQPMGDAMRQHIFGGAMPGQQPNQQPQGSPWPGMFPQGPQGQQDGLGAGGMGMLPQQFADMLQGAHQPRFWGGFNWGGQQQQQPNPGQSPYVNQAPWREYTMGGDGRGNMRQPMDGATSYTAGGWR